MTQREREREQAEEELARVQEAVRRKNQRYLLVKRGPTACATRGQTWGSDPAGPSTCWACGHPPLTHIGVPCTLCQFEIRLRKLEGTK